MTKRVSLTRSSSMPVGTAFLLNPSFLQNKNICSILVNMDVFDRIKSFSINMAYEVAEEAHLRSTSQPAPIEVERLNARFPITHAVLPNGKSIRLLKTMQTSVCENDCNYCCFRSGRDIFRASLTPDEMASAIVKLTRAGIVEGVFLSSGIAGGGVRSQDRLIATAELLRHKYHYQPYIHLKIMPGAEKAQIYRAMQLADRVSINLEAPNETSLARLAPRKDYLQQLLQPLELIETIRKEYAPSTAWRGSWPSSSTQFVVGAAGESDIDLLQTTEALRKQYRISRAYYSRFSPVENTPFENLPALNPWRQTRLYQAFFLLRDYAFDFEELAFTPGGNLSLEIDPKMAWAQTHLLENPVEISIAPYQTLLRIPGIGPWSARKIIAMRRYGKIPDERALALAKVSIQRAKRFILINGRRPPYQPELFACPLEISN